VLITWLSIAGSGSDLSHLGDSLTRQMMRDVFNEEKSMELSKDTSNAKQTSGKAKKRKLEEPLLQAQKDLGCIVDEETCFMALKALKSITYSALEDLRTTTVRELCIKIISILLKLQKNFANPIEVPPYGSVKCRTAIYKLLLAVVVTTCGSSHNILSRCIHIFSRGQMDNNSKVVQVCCQGLVTCRSIIEPIRRSLPGADPASDPVAPMNGDQDSDASELHDDDTNLKAEDRVLTPTGPSENPYRIVPDSMNGVESSRVSPAFAPTGPSESPYRAGPDSINGLENSRVSPTVDIEIEKEKPSEHSPMVLQLTSDEEMSEPESCSGDIVVIPSHPEIIPIVSKPSGQVVETPHSVVKPYESDCPADVVQDITDHDEDAGTAAILRSFVDSYPDEDGNDIKS